MLPLVSIVTPTFNRADYLPGLFESIRSQSYPNIEHIVIDGGSTDGTVELLRRYGEDSNVRWSSAPDGGVYDAVNRGLQLAKGQIVAYLNSDDRYMPWAVESAVDAFRRRPDVGLVYGDMIRFDPVTGHGDLVLHPPSLRRVLPRAALLGQPALFWSHQAVEELGGLDTRFRLAADHDLWVRTTIQMGAHKFDEVVAVEGLHQQRLTSGEAAGRLAMDELEGLRRPFMPSGRLEARAITVADRLLLAVLQRWSVLKYVVGAGWPRFRDRPHGLDIRRGVLILRTLPLLRTVVGPVVRSSAVLPDGVLPGPSRPRQIGEG